MDLVQDMPSAVEFPFLKSYGAVEVSALAAAALLQQVIDLLEVAYPIMEQESLRPQRTESIDEDVLKIFNIRIPIRPITPRPSINGQLSSDRAEELKRLLEQCLVLPDRLLPPTDRSEEPVLRYSIRQYFSLLAMHWKSEEVQTVLANIPPTQFLSRGIAASHPVLAYIQELQRIIAQEEEVEGEGKEGNGDEDEERDTSKTVALLARKSLSALRQAQQLRRQARGSLEEGDAHGAIETLTKALCLHCDNPYDQEDQSDDDDDEEDEDEDDEEGEENGERKKKGRGCLPRYLRTLLLSERASIYLLLSKDGDAYPQDEEEETPAEAALRDVELAMAMNDGFCAPAVAVKAQLLPLLQVAASEEEQAKVFAETAFEAYLLGGGADASLASSADEFARKACKARALEIFRQKQMETADTETESEGEQSTGLARAVNNSGLPRSWIVSSYFSSYNRISSAFSIQNIHSDRPFLADTDRRDESVELTGYDKEAFQLLSELVRTVEDVAYLSWNPTENEKIVVDSFATEEDFLKYVGQCRLVGQGMLEEWLELPDEKGEGEEMSDSLIDQSLGDTIVEESPPCPFLLKLVSLLLASSLTCGRILPYLPSSSLNSSLASILPSSNSELHDESDGISHRILARLLNVCGCVLYLLGNSKAAEEVLRSSIELDGQLEDSRIKLAALLIDMDDTEEAAAILHTVSMWGGQSAAAVRFQWAQLYMSQNDFKTAISHASSCVDILFPSSKKAKGRGPEDDRSIEGGDVERRASEDLASNAYAIWGMCKLKLEPNEPEGARSVLQKGADQTHGGSILLKLCLSDAACQCGDLRLAVSGYRNASCYWQTQRCPLPYIHAARLCVQLAQFSRAEELLNAALKMDPSLASAWTEVAQLYMQRRLSCRGTGFESFSSEWGHAIEHALEQALSLAKNFSEIVDVLAVKLSADIQISFISSTGI
eukprot:gene24173-32598_t